MDAKDIKMDVLLEVFETNAGGKICRLRVVQWNNGRPKLEKREYYQTPEGEERCGKCVGVDDEDFQLLMQKQEQIDKALTWEKPKKK